MVKQLAVLVENKPGALADLAKVLAKADVNITAVMIEGSLEFGTARLHVDRVRSAQKALADAGYQVTLGDALILDLPDQPGELHRITQALAKAKVNIECMFGTTGKDGAPQLVVKVSDEARAKKALGLG